MNPFGESTMPRLIRVACFAALLCLPALQSAAQEKLKETPYYPLQVGTTWHYRVGEGKIVVRVVNHEKVGDVLCALIETTRDGKVAGSEHLAVTADGVYRYDISYPLPLNPADARAKSKTGSEAVKESFKPPILVLKLPPKKGDSWKIDCKGQGKAFRGSYKVDDEKEITVPAGKYKTFVVVSQDLEGTSLKPAPTITTYYADGIGMVKQLIEIGTDKAEIVLEKFSVGSRQ
jgi:hypothetical protein